MPVIGGEDFRGRYRGTITDPVVVAKLTRTGAIQAEIDYLICEKFRLSNEFWGQAVKALGLDPTIEYQAKINEDKNADIFAPKEE